LNVKTFYYVYVLLSKSTEQLYTGCTSDLKKRLFEHQNGKSEYTRKRGPYELVYYEACLDKKDAFCREKYLKTGMGKRYINNRLKNYKKTIVGMNPVRVLNSTVE
jgi:putative endonuclease